MPAAARAPEPEVLKLKAEVPKAERPKPQVPQREVPKVELPKVELPKPELPRPEAQPEPLPIQVNPVERPAPPKGSVSAPVAPTVLPPKAEPPPVAAAMRDPVRHQILHESATTDMPMVVGTPQPPPPAPPSLLQRIVLRIKRFFRSLFG